MVRDEISPLVGSEKSPPTGYYAERTIHRKTKKTRQSSVIMFSVPTMRRKINENCASIYAAALLLQDAILGEFNSDDFASSSATSSVSKISNNGGVIIRNNGNTTSRAKSTSFLMRTGKYLLTSGLADIVVKLSAFILMALTFVEPPAWCSEGVDDLCLEYRKMVGIDEEGNEYQYYPDFGLPLLSLSTCYIVEASCTGVFTFYMLLRFMSEGGNFFSRRKNRRMFFVVMLLFLSLIVTNYYNAANNHAAPFVRLVAFSMFFSNVGRETLSVVKMLPDIFSILFILFFVVSFYAWMGVVLFYDSDEGRDNFSNIVEAMWTLWICVTTANYPDVMMPSYNDSRTTAIFFVSFMIIAFFFLMNVTLATVYNSYADEKSALYKYNVEKKNEYIQLAFKLLSAEGENTVDRDTVLAVFFVLNEEHPDIPYVKAEEAQLIFEYLDKDQSNNLDVKEFSLVAEAMLVEFDRADSYKTMVENRFPETYNSESYQGFCSVVKSGNFDRGIDILIFFNAIVCTIQSWSLLMGDGEDSDAYTAFQEDGKIDTMWEVLETLFTFLYCFEMAVKLLVFGTKRYIESSRNVFDGFITITSVLATVYVYYPNDYNNANLIRLVIMARVLRLIRLLNSMKKFQIIINTLDKVLPEAKRILILIFFLMYMFSIIGMKAFGGLITRDPNNPISARLDGTDFQANAYWANNFNDMMSGINVLFNLLVVNNWPEQADGILAVTGSKYSRFFFLGFHIFGVVIIMNIVVASIIDTFVNEWQESDGGASSKKWGSESTTVTFKNRKYIVRENVTLY